MRSNYQSLWGVGGAHDQLAAFHAGLGNIRYAPGLLVQAAQQGHSPYARLYNAAAQQPELYDATTDATTDTEATESRHQAECDCMMERLYESAADLAADPAIVAALYEQCLIDPGQVRDAAAREDINIDCRPWYKRPSYLIGSGAVLALGLGLAVYLGSD